MKRLHAKFADKDGYVSTDAFLRTPEVRSKPLIPRIIDLFDEDETGRIKFEPFLSLLALLKSDSKIGGDHMTGKAKLAFRAFDLDGSDAVSPDDMFVVLKAVLSSSLSDTQVRAVVVDMFKQEVADPERGMTFKEFVALLSEDELAEHLSVDYF